MPKTFEDDAKMRRPKNAITSFIENGSVEMYSTIVESIINSNSKPKACKIIAKMLMGAMLAGQKLKTRKELIEFTNLPVEVLGCYFDVQKISNKLAADEAVILKNRSLASAGGKTKKSEGDKLKTNRKALAAQWYYKNQQSFSYQYEAVAALLKFMNESTAESISPAGEKHRLSQRQAEEFIKSVFVVRKNTASA